MANLSPAQIAAAAINAGFSGVNLYTAIAIALAESGGDPNAVNPGTASVPENSQGLWQINLNAHPQYSSPGILDPLTNASAAYSISGGSNFNAWSTFTDGKYLSYLPQAYAAVVQADLQGVSTLISNLKVGGVPVLEPGAGVPFAPVANAVGSAANTASQTIQGQLPASQSLSFGSILSALSSLGSSAANASQTATQGLSDFRAIVSFLQDPALWTRFIVGVLGAILLIVGLVMFAASFISKGSIPVVVPA